jgi:hypothetical protein
MATHFASNPNHSAQQLLRAPHQIGANQMTTETITTTDAAELAHTYHWFMRDLTADNYAGVSIYGDWLLSMQARMGVELIDQTRLREIVRRANERYDAEMMEAA